MAKVRERYTIKQILLSKQNWWNFYNKYSDKIRIDIVYCIVKLLSCRNTIRGYHQYVCSNPNCSHAKKIAHTCKCKACSSCGKKATELWLNKQNAILPNTAWQHITFTMPSELWDFFWLNRYLLNRIGKIAANCIKVIADKKKIIPGTFIAIHPFGRDLKRNVHVHLSTTLGGIFKQDHTIWKKLYFDQTTLMRMWRYEIVKLFRDAYKNNNLVLPAKIQKLINHTFTFNNFLDALYKKQWIVFCAKPSSNFKINVEYLSRYIKRPPIAESKLRHYDGNEVTFKYLDRTTKTYRNFKLTVEQFIARFIQHIPDRGFRMIRYYGFLANRNRCHLLPKVYAAINQEPLLAKPAPSYAELIQKNFGFNPFICIICGCQLVLSALNFGKRTNELLGFHRKLALLKNFS